MREMPLEFKFLIGPEIVEAEQQVPENQRVPWPDDSFVLYAYEDEKLVGRMGVMSLRVVEGTWADEGMRGTTLAYRMLKQMEAFLKSIGSTQIGALSYDEAPVDDYLKRVGFERFPVEFYTKEIN